MTVVFASCSLIATSKEANSLSEAEKIAMQLKFSSKKYSLSQVFILSSPAVALIAPLPLEDVVLHYRQWLLLEMQRNRLVNTSVVLEQYRKEAMKPLLVDGREVHLFAPFREQYSALKTFTWRQRCFLVLLGLACLFGFVFLGLHMAVALLAMLTFLYMSDLLVTFFLSVRAFDASTEETITNELVYALSDATWPHYTILCPLYHEAEVVPQFVQAMQALEYPRDRLQVLFLTEEDDAATRRAIEDMRLPSYFSTVIVPDGSPRTKPRACNYGLLKATGDYVVIYDAEDVPDPLQLKKAVLAFAQHGENIACVQARLNFYNTDQNMLTRWFTAEYLLWFDLMLPALQRLGVPFPLGGTSNHFRADLLRRLGGWDSYNVTEDCDLGLRMTFYGLKTAVLDSTTFEEANSEVHNWLRQRSRWIKGYMQTYLVHMRQPLVYLRSGRWAEFLSLQLFVGGKTGVLFVNPAMWLLLLIYIGFAHSATALYHTLFPLPVFYMGIICLIFGNFFYTYMHLIGCMKRKQYHLVKWTLLIPLYWAMASAAAFLALQQLLFKPHYWEKTQHGLHLRSAGALPKITTVAEVVAPSALLQAHAETFFVDASALRVSAHSSQPIEAEE